jgi:hypothetical protein
VIATYEYDRGKGRNERPWCVAWLFTTVEAPAGPGVVDEADSRRWGVRLVSLAITGYVDGNLKTLFED